MPTPTEGTGAEVVEEVVALRTLAEGCYVRHAFEGKRFDGNQREALQQRMGPGPLIRAGIFPVPPL